MKKVNEKLKKNFRFTTFGFTLVELLAVIVILAIILVIAVPKVITVIDDSKKAALESTAKMIASQAEKAKVQNTLLGKTDEITCKDVAKLNDLDYGDCEIIFDDNTAKVTIEGTGKFEGLFVCEGTKTDAVATDNCDEIYEETDEACFTYQTHDNYLVKDEASCLAYTQDVFVDEEFVTSEELEILCSGEELSDGYTFHQFISIVIDNNIIPKEELLANNVIYVESLAEITGYDSSCPAELVIPKTINNNTVVSIGESAFQGKTLTKVIFPKTIFRIGNQAFSSVKTSYVNAGEATITGVLDLSKLTNLVEIGEYAFTGNLITKVKFPDSLMYIGFGAFSSNLITNIEFSKSIEMIDSRAFMQNKIDGTLDMSKMENLYSIGVNAFSYNLIDKVIFNENISNFGWEAFSHNEISGVLDLSYLENIKTIPALLFYDNNISEIKLPQNITTISSSAFTDNPDLTKIVNPTDISFDWHEITGFGSSDTCTFTTGTCDILTVVSN